MVEGLDKKVPASVREFVLSVLLMAVCVPRLGVGSIVPVPPPLPPPSPPPVMVCVEVRSR